MGLPTACAAQIAESISPCFCLYERPDLSYYTSWFYQIWLAVFCIPYLEYGYRPMKKDNFAIIRYLFRAITLFKYTFYKKIISMLPSNFPNNTKN